MAYVRTRLGRWFYEERGKARHSGDPAILLGHSFLCDGGMWRGQVPALAALGRVINIDGPGHGKSEVPPVFSLEDHAEAMLDAFSELGVADAIIVGLSWGAMVGMRLALRHPHRVAALALMDTSARKHSRIERVRYRVLVPFAREAGLPRPLIDREVAPKMFSPTTLRNRPEIVEEFARTVSGFDRAGIARAARAVMIERTDISAQLGAIQAPTLVLCGRDDAATAPVESELIARSIPGATLEWIESAGHLSALEQPELVARHLASFVRSVLARARD